MVEYSPGMRVIIRDEEWMVKKVERNNIDIQSLHCIGVSPLVRYRSAIFLTDLEEIIQVNPAEIRLVPDDSQYFKRSRLYIESQWRQQIPTDNRLHIGNQAAMDLMNYQLVPAQIALRRPKQRILIADTVGLGKTLEAGILMSELIARGKGKRILVVTVKSMMLQFQKEMWNRFTIPLIRLDSKKIQDIRAKLPSNYNPFFYYDKTIVSIDTLKRDVEYRTHLENATWDIIVIDEAHNVAERGGHQAQRARLAKLLAGRSDALIMLSATPHDGRSESFASLMNMLDPTAIADIHNYTKEDIRGLCIRRFKKDIKSEAHGAFQERSVKIEHCSASDVEERAFRIFADMTLEMDAGANHIKGTLFKTSLEKSLFSSPFACIKSLDERLRKLVKKYGENGFPDALNSQTDSFVQNDTVFGAWSPRQSSSHVSIYSGVSASEMKVKKTNAEVSVFATLLDSEDTRTDKYEVEWNGYLQFFNVMQFLGSFAAVTANGLAQNIYDAIPVVADSNHASAVSGQAVSSEWADTLEYINDSAKAMADKMIAIGVPVPSSVGFELEDNMGAVIAEAEMAWEERKIAYLLPEQEEYRTVFENQGWAVITDCTELAITIFEGRNS